MKCELDISFRDEDPELCERLYTRIQYTLQGCTHRKVHISSITYRIHDYREKWLHHVERMTADRDCLSHKRSLYTGQKGNDFLEDRGKMA